METKPLKPILESLFARLSEPWQQRRSALVNLWPRLVGSDFAKHTKPRFAADGSVTVWVDDSTLAFELSRRYKPVLLKRLRGQFGEAQVKDVKFFVGELR
ncbi:MAG: DUF721 domain-containing protein [Candidatus Omnitrophica bacterium]|nr:DUF721 domain-containing protein [Candidatus Omnitrophota bacterium]